MTVYREAPRNLQGSSFKKGGYWFGEYKIHTQKLTGSLYTENVNYLEARMEMITPLTIAMTEKKQEGIQEEICRDKNKWKKYQVLEQQSTKP